MIIRAARHQRCREKLLQRGRNQAQQGVALFNAILVVIGLHGFHIGIDQHRRPTGRTDLRHLLTAELVYIIGIGKICQEISVEAVSLEQAVGLYFILDRLDRGRQIRVSDHSELCPVRHGLPAAKPMNQEILALFKRREPATEDHVIRPLMPEELLAHL